MNYDIGQEVTLRAGNLVLKGRISDVTLTSAVLSFPVSYTLTGKGTLIWPDGLVAPLDLTDVAPQTTLALRLPLPQRKVTKKLGMGQKEPSESADHRRTIRIDVSLRARIADFTGTRRLMDAKTLNLSSGGVLVLCESPLIVGRDYTIKLDIGDEQTATKARVVRRIGHNTYALRFLADSEAGHALMRKVFMLLRAQEPRHSRRIWNFRKG